MRSIGCLALWLVFLHPAKADTTAVTAGTGPDQVGYVSGAVGFSFTPATNIVVTRVGYFDYGAGAPTINFWSGTNYIFASFSLVPGSNSAQMVYTNVALTLSAGQRYSITVQDGPTGTSPILVNIYTNFQVAGALSNYGADTVSSGAFTDYGPIYFIQGPDFMFTNQTGVVISPSLTIAQPDPTNAVVSWPASASGFILQQNLSLSSTNWAVATNAVSTVNGTNRISQLTAGDRFYRLFHP